MEAGGNLYRLDPPSEGAAPEAMLGAYYDHIRKVNDVFADQIKTSDQKAAYIFTFMFAFLVTSQEGRSVFAWQRYAEGSTIPMVFSAMLALASIFSIVSAILVVLPRKSATSTTLFWGAWSRHRESFMRAAGAGDRAYLFRQYAENADALAAIACGKYRCVSFAFRGLLVTVLSYICLLAVK
ncbi:Pycsar system effector family protein [Sinorhizobium arboris]|uniref:Pycsar system effector family protein n=1 Tax=Sinorhizobium arboris TaxID=76745 RepID=UPI00041C3CFC|nr:Pycsar system effector family protein [Sinorhizobium arboris]